MTAEKWLSRNLLKHNWINAVQNAAWNKGLRGKKHIKELRVSITGSYQHISRIYLPSENFLSSIFTLLSVKTKQNKKIQKQTNKQHIKKKKIKKNPPKPCLENT